MTDSPKNATDLLYKPPYWGAKEKPIYPYFLQVSKQGVELSHIPIDKHAFYVFGRDVGGDNGIQADHDSISRQHVVIQHASNGRVYLYDLNSTHGTFWNQKGKRIKPTRYVPLRLNDRIIIGGSTRSYVLDVDPKHVDQVIALEERLKQTLKKRKQPEQEKTRSKDDVDKHANNEGDSDYDSDDPNNQYEYDSEDDRRNKRLRIEDQLGDQDDIYRFDEEDEFYDRTMTNRTKASSSQQSKTETIDSLTVKQQEAQAAILSLKKQLQRIQGTKHQHQEVTEEDPLESFMNQVQDNLSKESQEQAIRIQSEIDAKQAEYDKLSQLIQFLTPAIPNLVSKDQKIIEAQRDLLLPDMFYKKTNSKYSSFFYFVCFLFCSGDKSCFANSLHFSSH
ncbi:kanadaptin [Acrasis kona]|uniref:Kanadaptin n=1 Tax=Acrasis kona TaxID=1008807 RepID=A0AAW2Z983_9EUKA